MNGGITVEFRLSNLIQEGKAAVMKKADYEYIVICAKPLSVMQQLGLVSRFIEDELKHDLKRLQLLEKDATKDG